MPEPDGYETTRAIRQSEGADRHTPIIAMTAHTMPGDRERCIAAGMDYYCGKPLKAAGLDYILTQVLPPANPAAAKRVHGQAQIGAQQSTKPPNMAR
jgi:CheY-like chemotaxis protein